MAKRILQDAEQDSEESQFVPQSGDEENLWEIVGIIREKGNKYKVKWAGEDPKTGKPWGNSWVKKSDVTPDVVEEWKEKQAEKGRRKSTNKTVSKAGSRKSNASAATKRATSTSTVTARRGRSSMAPTVKQERSPSPSLTPHEPPSISASPPKTTGKRKFIASGSPHSESESDLPDVMTLLRGDKEPQKKRRKVSEEVEVAKPRASTSTLKSRLPNKAGQKAHAALNQVDEESSGEEAVTVKRTRSSTTTTKRETRATRSSTKPLNDVKTVSGSNAKGKGRANAPEKGKGTVRKSEVLVSSDEDDDEGSRTEVVRQLTSPSGNLSESEDDLIPKAKADRSNGRPIKSTTKTPKSRQSVNGRSTKRNNSQDDRPETDVEDETGILDTPATFKPASPTPTPCLTPWALQRLKEFDESMARLDDEATSTSEHPPAVPYGESDVDSAAVDIMYPPTDGEVEHSKRRKKAKAGSFERESTLPVDVPEIVLQPTTSPSQQPTRPIPNTPSRSSLKAKMKPRTPRSGAGSLVSFADIPEAPAMDLENFPAPAAPVQERQTNGKVNGAAAPKPFPKLRPLPQISPSKFYPHLPSSALNDSIIEEEAEPEVDEPMSSIEQFESPDKPARTAVVPAPPNNAKDKQRASPVEDEAFWASSIVLDVERMRERAAQKGLERQNGGESAAAKRRTLEEVIEHHRASSRATPDRSSSPPVERSPSRSPPQQNSSPPPRQETLEDDDDFYVDEQPPADEGTLMEQEEEDLEPVVPQFVREEEEENTQDILHELEVQKAVSEDMASRSSSPEGKPESEVEPQSSPLDAPAEEEVGQVSEEIADVSMEPQPGTNPVGLEYPAEEGEESQPQPPSMQPEETQEIPATLSTHREEDSQESNKTSTTIDSTEQKEHIGYMTLLHAKSEEINELVRLLHEERTRSKALEEQVELAKTTAASVEKEAVNDLAQKLDASTRLLAEVRANFEAERQALRVQLEALQKEVDTKREQHDNVMTMFREANGRAEGLLREKKALSKELEIAQKQAREGVLAQKAYYKAKLKKEKDSKQQQANMAEMLLKLVAQRAPAVGNAANAKEIHDKYRHEKLKRRQLEEELDRVREENKEPSASPGEDAPGEGYDGSGSDRDASGSSVSSQESHRSQSPREASPDEYGPPQSQAMMPVDQDETEEEDLEEMVIPCRWITDGIKCNGMFKTRPELQAHMHDAGHIPRRLVPAAIRSVIIIVYRYLEHGTCIIPILLLKTITEGDCGRLGQFSAPNSPGPFFEKGISLSDLIPMFTWFGMLSLSPPRPPDVPSGVYPSFPGGVPLHKTGTVTILERRFSSWTTRWPVTKAFQIFLKNHNGGRGNAQRMDNTSRSCSLTEGHDIIVDPRHNQDHEPGRVPRDTSLPTTTISSAGRECMMRRGTLPECSKNRTVVRAPTPKMPIALVQLPLPGVLANIESFWKRLNAAQIGVLGGATRDRGAHGPTMTVQLDRMQISLLPCESALTPWSNLTYQELSTHGLERLKGEPGKYGALCSFLLPRLFLRHFTQDVPYRSPPICTPCLFVGVDCVWHGRRLYCNQSQSDLRKDVGATITLDIDVSQITNVGIVATVGNLLIALFSFAFFVLTLLPFLRRWANKTLRLQVILLTLSAVWVFACMVPYMIYFMNDHANVRAFIGQTELPQSLVEQTAASKGRSTEYQTMWYLRLLAIFPWFAIVSALVAAFVAWRATSAVNAVPPPVASEKPARSVDNSSKESVHAIRNEKVESQEMDPSEGRSNYTLYHLLERVSRRGAAAPVEEKVPWFMNVPRRIVGLSKGSGLLLVLAQRIIDFFTSCSSKSCPTQTLPGFGKSPDEASYNPRMEEIDTHSIADQHRAPTAPIMLASIRDSANRGARLDPLNATTARTADFR
ncbi:hypothetical protein NMY22_g997 [Coprinellus aureogranulatus]|nr:hypothetical protein NMY22_g997 [Coprinellus aureogranulatus]